MGLISDEMKAAIFARMEAMKQWDEAWSALTPTAQEVVRNKVEVRAEQLLRYAQHILPALFTLRYEAVAELDEGIPTAEGTRLYASVAVDLADELCSCAEARAREKVWPGDYDTKKGKRGRG